MGASLGEHTFARQLTPLRAEPEEGSEQVTQALAGEPLRVLEAQGEWVLVETAYAYPGWARRVNLAGEPDPEWLRPVAADPVEHARALLGARYEWGGMTSAGIDCSGLVHMAFRACGRLVPRDADQQEEAGERLAERDLRVGDLVTYGPPGGGRPHRVLGRRRPHSSRNEPGRNRLRPRGARADRAAREPPRVRAPRALDFAAHVEPTAFPGRAGAVVAALPLLALVFVAGCGGSGRVATSTTVVHRATTAVTTTAPSTTTSPTNPREFPEFRIAMDEATDYLDPGLSDTTEGWGVMWNVYLPLLGYRHVSGPAGARLVPYLAAALPRISRDGKTYRLTLREGLKYSNGADVKASDFKATVERDFRLDSAGAAFFLNIRGAEAFAKAPTKGGIKGIQVDNATGTIVIHLKQPQADFSNALASEFAAPVPADAPATDTSLDPLPATGPYVIKSYQPKSGIVEERNPNFKPYLFHGAVPRGNPDRVTWDIVPDASVALHRVLSGKDDWMSYYQVPSKRLDGIEHKHESQLRVFAPPNLMYFFMNTRVPPFTSLKVRQAVNYAISRRWLKRLDGGLAGTTENVLPPGYPAFRGHRLYRHDLRKAIRLVHESGYWHWRRKVFVWNHDVPTDLPFTKYLVAVLKQLGFRAAPKVVTAGSYWTTIGNGKTRAQVGFADFIQDYPHPLDWFRLLDGQTITPTHNSNYANFDVGAVNREIARLTRPTKQTRSVSNRWAALDRNVMRLAPWAPFLNQEETDFFSSRVDLGCYVNNVLYEFDYASICVRKK